MKIINLAKRHKGELIVAYVQGIKILRSNYIYKC